MPAMQTPFPSREMPTLFDERTGDSLPFAGVTVRAEIGAVMTRVEMAQRYENRSGEAVETVYTFPLPDKAVLLSFSARIGKSVIDGVIEAKEKAADRYERAIHKGRSAAMVEMAGEGLLTAHLGNLPAGESAELTLAWIEFNAWRDGELRWSLPTCVAPRFGRSPFEPQNEPTTSRGVRHEADIRIVIAPEISDSDISTSGHRLARRDKDGAITLASPRKGVLAMDRDINVTIRARRDISALRVGKADGATVALMSFVPRWKSPRKGGRSVKIVLDCSYSMSGASIETARQAVELLLGEIGTKDDFNLIRFGSSAQAIFPAQAAGTQANRAMAEKCIAQLSADMGGTDISAALDLAYRSRTESDRPGTVILVTDGQAHDDGTIVAAAAASRHRIFCIGIGTAINHGLLSAIAEESGGSAEFISPGEDVGQAILRQFRRVRSGSDATPVIEWPGNPVARSTPPINSFSGDAIHAVAIYDKAPKGSVAFRISGTDGERTLTHFDFSETKIEAKASDLVRAAAGRILGERIRRFDMETDPERRLEIGAESQRMALRFGLLSPWTSFVLVSKSGKKLKGQPILHKVSQMAPAGWHMFAGATRQAGTVLRAQRSLSVPTSPLSASAPRAAVAFGLASAGDDAADFGMPKFIDGNSPGPWFADGTRSASPLMPAPASGSVMEQEQATERFLVALDLALAQGRKVDSAAALKSLSAPDWILSRIANLMACGKSEKKAVQTVLLEAADARPMHFSMSGKARLQMAA